jgi:molybdopterin-guanine dinucleotide biosynthesis protein MobB
MLMNTKVVSFVAWSGTGKTTLLEKVVRELKRRGHRVGTVKYDAHRFDIDQPGKDSYRMTAAGADTMLLVSGEKLAMVKKHHNIPPVEEILNTYFADVDIVLVEGAKKSDLPKIEVHRKVLGPSFICRGNFYDPCLIAVASDEPLDIDVPVFDVNDAVEIAGFIEERVLQKA